MSSSTDMDCHAIADKLTNRDDIKENCVKTYQEIATKYDVVCGQHIFVYQYVAEMVETVMGHNKNIEILDVGAGTGWVAQNMKERGFLNIDALDPSDEMLKVSKSKNIYRKYTQAYMTAEPLDIPKDSYDLITVSGALALGFIHLDAFPEMCRIVKPGGYIIFGTADHYRHFYEKEIDTEGLLATIKLFEEQKLWKFTQKKKFDRYVTLEGVDKPGHVYVCQVL